MRSLPNTRRILALRCSAGLLAVAATLAIAPAAAQTIGTQADDSPAKQAGAEDKTTNDSEIVVTGSRIQRAGFNQPTPTTVIGDAEIRQGARPNLQQILNDQPQFRPSVNPGTSNGVTSNSGVAPVDLRGLGFLRTLVLINGRRFVGQNNLNFVPINLVDRMEVVTGGASAAWGSGAVAGVVNIILKDDLQGFSLGGERGISSRGDGSRYQFDGSWGTRFADGRGHLMIGAEYLNDHGIPDRRSRPNLNSPGIITIRPGVQQLVEDVNYPNQSHAGVINSGIFKGMTFNPDGTLRPFQGPNALGVGGADAVNLYDDIYAATPNNRFNVYARASYEIGDAKLWVDGNYSRVQSNYPFLPDIGIPQLTLSATNPFLSAAIRSQLAAAGQASFTFGRVFADDFLLHFDAVKRNKEGAVGIDGGFGGSWKYHFHYSHGEINDDQKIKDASIKANLANALNAASFNGNIVCAINASAAPLDPNCAPLNPFGQSNASAAALAYTRGTQQQTTVTKLDSAGASLQGDLVRLWAGPVTVALGAEARRESQSSHRGSQSIANLFSVNIYSSDLSGKFTVKEGFGEVAVPLLDVADIAKIDLNAAARYSDYSTSGGIWSWKAGGTARLLDTVLLRITRSRDIRSASVNELFSIQRINVGPLVDGGSAGRTTIPGYNPTPAQVTTFSGGNPSLKPEISSTLTFGATLSPRFLPGLNLSVDYYKIKIDDAIVTLTASQLTLACANGSPAACARIMRDPTTQTVTTVFANAQNIASFETRGIDMEASYALPFARLVAGLDGTLRLRALATYIDRFVQDTGVTRIDTAGDVGDSVTFGVPHWRGIFSATYQTDRIGLDARVRYVGGGSYNHLLTTLINNHIASRTYVDVGGQVKLDPVTLFGTVDNVFDRKAPLITTGSAFYDIVGTYFTIGARLNF